ncbi:hypothetical protein RDABS01_013572 [Bienertia sinuspersici]
MTSMSRHLSYGEQNPSVLNVDRLSSLPWGIMNKIFGKMTIVDAVKTSVLAKSWRYKWLSCSDFSLDSGAISRMLSRGDLKSDVVTSIINRFLLHHTSSIRSFSLKTCFRGRHSDMYQWIQYLSKQDVEVLVIRELDYKVLFKMPSYVFAFEKLKSLSLTNCALQIPSTFGRFNWMEQILLRNVSISDGDLARLILSCPLLEKLTLLNICGLVQLKIYAPRLTALMIDTGYEDIFIKGAPCLFVVSIATNFKEPGDMPIVHWHSVIHCLNSLGSLHTLSLSGEFIKVLADDYGLDYLPLKNGAVKSLTLHDLRFESIKIFRVCLSLLSTCHNIKHLRLYIEAAKGAKMAAQFFKENQGQFCFTELETFTVICPSYIGMGSSVNFIDFVITHCPNLKFLTIEKGGDIGLNNGRVSSMLHRFRMSCPNAIVFYEQDGKLTSL